MLFVELLPAIAELVVSTLVGAGVSEAVKDLDIPDILK